MSRKLKILFDAGPIVNGQKSGVGYYSYHLLEALAKNYPDEVIIVAHYFNFLNRRKNIDLPKATNIRYVETKLIPGKILNLVRRLGFQLPLELFFKTGGDVAIFPNFVSLPSLFRIPRFVAVHDLCYEDVPKYVAKRNRAFLHRFVPISVRSAARVITISNSTKKSIQRHYKTPDKKFIVTSIPPVDRSDIKPRKPSGVVGKFILFVSTLEPRKNVIGLIKAYEALPSELKQEYGLVLAGGAGWYMENELAHIKKLQHDGENIVTLGYISDAEKRWLFENASAFVLPSHYEGFGMPILEAMSYGVPTAISNISVFHEVADKASVYFDKDQPSSIASALAELLTNNELRKKLITKGHKQVQKVSWSDVAETVYRAVTSSSKSR